LSKKIPEPLSVDGTCLDLIEQLVRIFNGVPGYEEFVEVLKRYSVKIYHELYYED
jgi:hypothetical protein